MLGNSATLMSTNKELVKRQAHSDRSNTALTLACQIQRTYHEYFHSQEILPVEHQPIDCEKCNKISVVHVRYSPSDSDPFSTGLVRYQQAVGYIYSCTKSIYMLLHGAYVGATWWPAAAHQR
jgi:hypothetical protein